MVVDDIFTAKFFCSCKPANSNLSLALNVTHWRVTSITTPPFPDSIIASSLSTIFAPLYLALFNVVSRYEGVIIQRVSPLPLGLPKGTNLGNGVGARTGEQLPTQVCGQITKRTNDAGRRFRGRAYVPFPTEADNTVQGFPDPAYIALVLPLAVQMVSVIVVNDGANQATLVPGIFHKPPPIVTPNFTQVTSGVVRAYFTTQRRRSNAFRTDTVPIFPA